MPAKQVDPVKRLAQDWAYSTPYQTDADGGHRSIHAYSNQAEERKRQFLKDSRAYLKAVAKELEAHGFTEHDIHVNESGIAGSGDVHADFKKPGLAHWIYISITETCVRVPVAYPAEIGEPLNTLGALTSRQDGICFMARRHDPPPSTKHSYIMGRNVWLDANHSSREIVPALLRVVGIEPERLPAREAVQTSLFEALAA